MSLVSIWSEFKFSHWAGNFAQISEHW